MLVIIKGGSLNRWNPNPPRVLTVGLPLGAGFQLAPRGTIIDPDIVCDGWLGYGRGGNAAVSPSSITTSSWTFTLGGALNVPAYVVGVCDTGIEGPLVGVDNAGDPAPDPRPLGPP